MNKLIAAILSGFTQCQVRRRLYKEMRRASLSPPARLHAMLRTEKPQYVAAAILAVNTLGE